MRSLFEFDAVRTIGQRASARSAPHPFASGMCARVFLARVDCSLCSFPTRQSAHDWITKHRLALARHYLRDPRISPSELEANSAADGMQDEYYLVRHRVRTQQRRDHRAHVS